MGRVNKLNLNVNSWMVIKSNHCCQKNGQWKTCCGNRTVTSKSSIGELYSTFVQWGLTFWNLNKHHCFIVLYISIWEGGLELCFGRAKPTKDPVVTGLCGKTSAWFLMQLTRKST